MNDIVNRRREDLVRAAESGPAALIREMVAWERPRLPDTRELHGIESFCKELLRIADELEQQGD